MAANASKIKRLKRSFIANQVRRTAFTFVATAAFLLLPIYATAEPIKLKLSFFTSGRSSIYQYSIRPFVDAASEVSADILAE